MTRNPAEFPPAQWSPIQLAAAELIHDYLGLKSQPAFGEKADVAIGFGHFDLRIAERCMEIKEQGCVSKVIFTGGVGAGSADFTRPEAEEFKAYALNQHPACPESDIIVENRSTNTGENVRYTSELLLREYPSLAFGSGIRAAILVATPFRMRRVWLTFKTHFGMLPAWCMPPESSLEQDCAVFQSKGEDLISQLPGEVDRLKSYPEKGWIVGEPIPPEIFEACRTISTPR